MKKLITMAVLALVASPVSATVFNDSVGDEITGAGGGILDIVSVEVTNDASNINFSFTLTGDIVTTNWGKYMVIIDSAAGGDTVGNGWARPISMTSGADSWLGSWVDGGGGMQAWNFDGTNWNQDPTITTPVITTNTTTITASLAVLGLAPGDTIQFDAFTSGGGPGDGAIDSLGDPNQHVAAWGDPSNAVPVSYTLVPEPTSLVLFGFGALALLRRRR